MKTIHVQPTGQTFPTVHLASVGPGPLGGPQAATKCWLLMPSSKFSDAFTVTDAPATCATCTKV